MKRKIVKRIGIGVGVFLSALVVAAVAIPFLVDVDKFRPQIVEAANQNLNGRLEMGKLRLSLWGQVKIQIAGLALSDVKGRRVLSVSDVYFHLPLWSLLTGSPQITFRMNKPEVIVVKDKVGINVLSLAKTNPPGPAAPPPVTESKETSALPGMVTRARLGIEMKDARLLYTDVTTDLTSRIDALNVRARDLSLSRPADIEISADLDTRLGKVLKVKGPAMLKMTASPSFVEGKFQQAAVTVAGDLDKIEIQYGDLFKKASGIPMGFSGTLSATNSAARINSLLAKFHNAELKVSGGMTGLNTERSAIEFHIVSNPIALAAWAQLVPMLKTYELSGSASLSANAQGPTDALKYDADLKVQALRAKSPLLKAQPQIDAGVKVLTDKIERADLSFKAPGNDLQVTANVVSFTKPRASVQVRSSGMDLDQLIVFPATSKAGSSSSSSAASSTQQKTESNYDDFVAVFRDNEVLRAADATVGIQMKYVKAYNVRLEPIEGQFSLKQAVASVDNFRMGLFDGTLTSTGAAELKPKVPRYRFQAGVAGLDLKKAVTSQYELFKNTLYGKASFQITGRGESFNPALAKKNLDATGGFSVADASFASMDIGKMATEAVNKALGGLESKIPQLRGKRLGPLANYEGGYEKISSTFSIRKGAFSAPNFSAVSGKRRGIDVQGSTVLGLTDYQLDATWELVDTHNLTGAKNLTIESHGVRVDPLLAAPGSPVRFPIKVTGTLFSPTPSYTAVPEALLAVATANIARAVEGKAKAELAARAKAEAGKLQQKAPPAVKKAIEDLGKKLKLGF